MSLFRSMPRRRTAAPGEPARHPAGEPDRMPPRPSWMGYGIQQGIHEARFDPTGAPPLSVTAENAGRQP